MGGLVGPGVGEVSGAEGGVSEEEVGVGDAERSGVDEGPDGYAGAEDAGVSAADVGGTVNAGRGIGKVGGDVAEEDGCFVAGKPGEERLDLLEDSDGGSLPATMVGGRLIATGVEEVAAFLEFGEEGSADFEVGVGEGAVDADPEADFFVFG